MAACEITLSIPNEGTRDEIRRRVIREFIEEPAGTGTGDKASSYVYYVEKLNDGKRVYLKRPAALHNGFDFLVCVENENYATPTERVRVRNYPKHDDIAIDLKQKKAENPEEYKRLYTLSRKVYECHDVTDDELLGFSFKTGRTVDRIVKVLKWLFIEQDIRYWNYSGRAMTWEIVPAID